MAKSEASAFPGTVPLLLGMVHLPPLPGAPGWSAQGGVRAWLEHAVRDAVALGEAGFDGVIVENYGDAPFFSGRVPPETVAALAVATRAVRDALPRRLEVGVNVLRNDGLAALAIAAASGLGLVRVNVLTGAALTDQGIVEGEAARILRERARLAPQAAILADLRVKHAAPLAERPLDEEARDLWERGGADALILTGPSTGEPVDVSMIESVRRAVPDAKLLIGSGATSRTIGRLLRLSDGVIVGTALKRGGRTSAPVDPKRAARFVDAARG